MKELEIKAYKYNSDKFNFEFKNAIQDYRNIFNFDLTSKQNRGSFFNLPCSFDIETTNFIDDNNEKLALCYIWQFGIYNHVWYGRNLSEFATVLTDVSHVLDDIRKSEFKGDSKALSRKYTLCIYVHNLNFEFSFIHRLINIKSDSILALNKHSLIKFDIVSEFKHVNIQFRCSEKLTGLSLRNCAEKTFKRKIRKQPAIDYKLIRTPETELTDDEIQYAVYDVYVTNNIIHEKYETGEFQSAIPFTATGYPRQYLIGLIKSRKSPEYEKIQNSTKIKNTVNYKLYKHCFYGGFTHSSIRHCFMFREKVGHLDITSSYPTVLLSEKYPRQEFKSVYQCRGKETNFNQLSKDFIADSHGDINCKDFEFWNKTPIEKLRDMGYGFIINVLIYELEYDYDVIDDCFLAKNMIRNIVDIDEYGKCNILKEWNGRIKHAQNVLLTLTDVDYKLLLKTYKIYGGDVIAIYYSVFDYLPYEVCKTILYFYSEKTKNKGLDEILYQNAKQKLNSIYGMCVTDRIRDEFLYEENTHEIISEYDLIDNNYELNKLKELKIYNSDRNNYLFIMWGIYCLSYARKNLIYGIMECGHDYLYSDTDSIFTLNYDKHKSYFETYNTQIQEKIKNNTVIKNDSELKELLHATDKNGVYYPLGVWELDDSIKIDGQKKKCDIEFCSIGAKRYMQIFTDKETGEYLDFKITFAGVDPKILKTAFWENFKHDLDDIRIAFMQMGYDETYEITISPEQNTKLASYVSNGEFTGEITDYNGNKYKYHIYGGTHLFNVGFKVSQLSENMKYVAWVNWNLMQEEKRHDKEN